MKFKNLLVAILMLSFLGGIAAETKADISKAAVLFLRIAAGARPAGMGDAFVAIADDATATHWNPAGLGAYPLSSSWRETKIPSNLFSNSSYRNADVMLKNNSKSLVIKAFAPVKVKNGNDYQSFEYWVLTSRGLARYDNKNWYPEEKFQTKTNQTLEGIVGSYVRIEDDEELAKVIHKIATANSSKTYEELVELQSEILKIVPADYNMLDGMKTGLDALVDGYDKCLINWARVKKIEDFLKDAKKDDTFTEKELDQINFAIEKAKNRFLPEELIIPYSYLFAGEPVSIASSEKQLLVATTEGLVIFNGRQWRSVTDDNIAGLEITSLFGDERTIYIGTSAGIFQFNGLKVVSLADTTVIPAAPVTAIGGTNINNLWAVVGGDLYHYDGNNWRNSHSYTVVLDDSIEKIAKKFSLYGTEAEATMFTEKLIAANKFVENLDVMDAGDGEKAIEATPKNETNSLEEATAKLRAESATEVADAEVIDEKTEVVAETSPPKPTGIDFSNLEAGTVIQVPYVASLKGNINALYSDFRNDLWIGTDYGILHFSNSKWSMPGYAKHTVTEGQTMQDIVAMKVVNFSKTTKSQYVANLKEINDLSSDELEVGSTILIYKNSAANYTSKIVNYDNLTLFATSSGLLEFDGKEWRRFDLKGMGKENIVEIRSNGDELWIVSDKKFIARANGRTEITAMHVNWLPELADDLYYEYFGIVTHLKGVGTVGINATFITYGSITRTGQQGKNLGTFEAFDFALTTSYGAPLTSKLRGGISAKMIYSKLSVQGTAAEQGKGTATGFSFDLGLLYEMNERLNLGMAITNIGPKMTYIDAAQADPLPTNLAMGFAYKVLRSDFYQLIVTGEGNKMLVGLDSGVQEIFKTSQGLILNGGMEFQYINLLALRAGYIYDEEGDIKAVTLGFGLNLRDLLRADFAYIPSSDDVVLANTLRFSLTLML